MSTELAVYKLSDMQVMSEAIAQSGLFGMKTPAQALALMLVAQAENSHPATITQDYDIIQGKACRKTHSVLARFQQAGGKVEWHSLTDLEACATFSHPSGGALKMNWTFEQAKKAGLTNKDNWKNYPRAMLRARLIAEGIRAVYPAAIGGMLIAEEAQDLGPASNVTTIDASTGEITPAPKPALAPYADANFDVNFPKWRGLIESGKKTPDDIVRMVSSKAILSADQLAAINGCKKLEPVEVIDPKTGEVDEFVAALGD